jgi:hypothetical protein
MSTPRPIRLEIPPEALPAVTFALQRTIDDLEARAIVATDHDPDLGPPSAVEYRTDIARLAELLGQLGHAPARPDPERAAVVWVDGVYTIEQGQPRRMTATARLSELLGAAIEARREGRITPGLLIELVAEATGTTTLETAEQLKAARQLARRADARPNAQTSQRLAGPGTSAR